MIVYSAAQPSKDGEPSSFTKMLNGYTHLNEDWERINTARTKIMEQAAHDKHLLYSAEGTKHIDLNYPEYVSQLHSISFILVVSIMHLKSSRILESFMLLEATVADSLPLATGHELARCVY